MTHDNFMQLEELAVSRLIPHDSTYDDDDCSTDSYLNYCQQEGNTYKHVDSYNFVHDTEPTFLKNLMMSTTVISTNTMTNLTMVLVLPTYKNSLIKILPTISRKSTTTLPA